MMLSATVGSLPLPQPLHEAFRKGSSGKDHDHFRFGPFHAKGPGIAAGALLSAEGCSDYASSDSAFFSTISSPVS